MPTKRGVDQKGSFYRYGPNGKKYYYKTGNVKSREKAKRRSKFQGRAIKGSKTKHKKKRVLREKLIPMLKPFIKQFVKDGITPKNIASLSIKLLLPKNIREIAMKTNKKPQKVGSGMINTFRCKVEKDVRKQFGGRIDISELFQKKLPSAISKRLVPMLLTVFGKKQVGQGILKQLQILAGKALWPITKLIGKLILGDLSKSSSALFKRVKLLGSGKSKANNKFVLQMKGVIKRTRSRI